MTDLTQEAEIIARALLKIADAINFVGTEIEDLREMLAVKQFYSDELKIDFADELFVNLVQDKVTK